MSCCIDKKLYWACWRGDHQLANKLLLEGANPTSDLARGVYRDTPLHLACRHGWLDTVRLLVEDKEGNLNVMDCGKQTPLHYASLYGHEDIARYLILKGCDTTVLDAGKWTPLHSACRYGHSSVARCLIDDVGIDCEVRNDSQCTPLHLACQHSGSPETVRYLVTEKCCNVYAKDKMNRTPVEHAYRSGNCEILACLVKELGCDTFTPEQCQKIAICASKSGDIQLLDKMVKSCSKPQILQAIDKEGSLLEHACRNGQLSVLKYFQPLTLEENKAAAMILEACRGGHSDIVEYLVSECGCLVAINGEALLSACEGGFCDLVEYLIRLKGPGILSGKSSRTAKFFQSISNLKIIKILLDQGVAPKLEDTIHWLFSSLNEVDALDLMKLLLERNMWDPNNQNVNGYCAIHLACITDRSMLASYLLTDCPTKVNVIAKSTSGELPIDLTTNAQIVIKLVKCGATIQSTTLVRLLQADTDDHDMVGLIRYLVKTNRWYTALALREGVLHLACNSDRLGTVRSLLDDAKCDPNSLNRRGATPLQLSSDIDVIKELIYHGAHISHLDLICLLKNIPKENFDDLYALLINEAHVINDAEILCLACKSGRVSMVHYLLSNRNLDPNVRSAGESPLQSTTNPEIVKVLLKQGAVIDGSEVLKWLSGTMKELSVLQVVRYLIDNNIWDPNEAVDYIQGDTILHLACEHNQNSVVEYLLTVPNCNPNVLNNLGKTPIQLTSNLRIVKLLLKQGAEVNDSDNWWDNI